MLVVISGTLRVVATMGAELLSEGVEFVSMGEAERKVDGTVFSMLERARLLHKLLESNS